MKKDALKRRPFHIYLSSQRIFVATTLNFFRASILGLKLYLNYAEFSKILANNFTERAEDRLEQQFKRNRPYCK